MEFAERYKRVPGLIFTELEDRIKEQKEKGVDLVSLSIGDPDLDPPEFFVKALKEEISKPNNHKYSVSKGEEEYRESVSEWYDNRFDVDLDHKKEIVGLIGAKEGIANVARAFINPGDEVLVPDPAYPVYKRGSTILNGGRPVKLDLLPENDFLPDLDKYEGTDAKMMYLNYPNNPTATVADKDFLREAVDFAHDNEVMICYDNCYSEITFDGYRAPSILEIEGAKEVAIEFNSFSKMFSGPGNRIGFAAGSEKLVKGLSEIKAQVDSGPPIYTQKAAARALERFDGDGSCEYVEEVKRKYAERRDILIDRLREFGFDCKKPKATFFIWFDCSEDSMEFTEKLLEDGVLISPGKGFSEHSETYVRFSVTRTKQRIKKACRRIDQLWSDCQ
ncbi:MAG: aminotransferase class I/II-fold pyridoxal phosphate-dependent enzyme [Candidatus Thermoplasmatota archaeon]|nr:aminotransferase class I/II-fold pyridoxal phosphate-dependent enzyme [Candidatus Thermoplasmatota archaeon]